MDIHEYAGSRKCFLRPVTDFAAGVNPLGPSNKAKHAIRKGVRGLDVFPDEAVTHLRRYLSRQEGVGEDRIVFGAGSTALLNSLISLERPGTVGVLLPVSSRLEKGLLFHGVTLRPIPVSEKAGFSVDTGLLLGAMRDTDMLIISRPHDMTGAVISAEGQLALMEEADRTGKTLVIDEAYRDYTDLDSCAKEAAASDSALILRTFSLFHGLAGLRLGYGVGSAGLVGKLSQGRPTLQVNGLAPSAALQSLRDAGYRTRTLKFIKDEKAYVRQKASRLKGVEVVETVCNFSLLAVDREREELERSFLERGILVQGYSGEDGRTYLRMPMGTHKENAYLMRVMRRITGV
jgi:threonine-phosphate decarboxylase